MNEEEFWDSTLRKICALLDVHSRVNEPKKQNSKEDTKTRGETITLKCLD